MAVYSQRRKIGKIIMEKKYYFAILARIMNSCILENHCFGIIIKERTTWSIGIHQARKSMNAD